jgi:hypothetical protein
LTAGNRRSEGPAVGPGLERALLGRAPLRILHAQLRRIDVEQPPDDSALQHLPQRLGRLEAISGPDRHPPGGDLMRFQFVEPTLAERGDGVREQPAQLLERDR